MASQSSRRGFLKTASVASLATAASPYWFAPSSMAAPFRSPNERPILGCIGTGDRWKAVGRNAMKYADCVSVCDVDANHKEEGRQIVLDTQKSRGSDQKIEMHEDYRRVLDNKDIEVVTIVTPDHWHTKIAIDAMRAGKDVYCEKPLTLTINEGKQIRKVLEETGRVFQVGTQQRSEMGLRFLHAVAMIREGRIGDLKNVIVAIGGAPTSGSIPVADVPAGLNWDMWLGQAPAVDFRFKESGRWGNSRCHYEFRWWYEYSGGKMTDWGAHHVDIAMWALGMDDSGPVKVDPIMAVHPVPYKDGHPQDDSQYNAATKFHVLTTFEDGRTLHIHDNCEERKFGNGLLFEGTEGTFFVDRGKLIGAPVDALKSNPLKEETLKALYKGKEPGDHMRNFIECVADRTQPISDVHSHHRAMTTCHLANIAIRLDRALQWDPKTEQIVDDAAANQWLAREQRKGYEIEA
ncbi:MAG: Gfo/Idh/MocA family oxidoreductase [Planctomycetaceae bacterium]|nr:Gfo/Idh/MocA family oxidoreductase [Planctomycetaceae bacterium]